VEAAEAAGLSVDDFAPRLTFFFNAHNQFLEEVAKYRAARRLWARIMKERFGATNPKSLMLRFHTQTGGSTLTAQQPENNMTRVALQALAAVMGGTQSLHTNAMDEALALPTAAAAQAALRTQQIIAHESGVCDTVDPLAGSFAVEALTDEIETRAQGYIGRIDELGGALTAIESGYTQREIQDAAYAYQRAIEQNEQTVVGVNAFVAEEPTAIERLTVDAAVEARQRERVAALRVRRDHERVSALREELAATARGAGNLMPLFIECVENDVTLGEICHTLREVWGEYRPTSI
jgi:methylmalonyl-CoA mutase N-terminal domain/subunit